MNRAFIDFHTCDFCGQAVDLDDAVEEGTDWFCEDCGGMVIDAADRGLPPGYVRDLVRRVQP